MAGIDSMVHGHADAIRLSTPDRATLALSGVLTFATAARALAAGQRALAAGEQTRLDLAGITRADSAGLACVLVLAATARRAGRRLEVVRWPEGLHALAAVCDVAGMLDSPAPTV
jgi:phospholipid transport system transporter-binding protein